MIKFAWVLVAVLALGAGCSSSSSNSGGNDDCAKICANEGAVCQALPPSGSCKAQQQELMDCQAGATFTCDSSGTSEAKACQSKSDAWTTCLSGGGSSSTGAGGSSGGGSGGSGGSGTGSGTPLQNCMTACMKADALHCPSDTPGACAGQCPTASASPQCAAEFSAAMACAAGSTFACGSSGKATVQGCANEGAAYIQCVLGSIDGGGP